MRSWMLVAVLGLTTLAGCLDDEGDSDNQDDLGKRPPAIVLEDVLAAWSGGNVSANMHHLGIWGEGGGEEVDAWGDYVFVDRGSTIYILERTWNADGSLGLETVSSIDVPGAKDVKVSDDGMWAFVGNDEQLSMAPLGGTPLRAGGFYVLDFADKTAPKIVSYLPVGPLRGPHMVFYHQQPDGTEWVFGANADISINHFDRETGTLHEVSRYAANPVTDVNRDPEVLDAYYQLYAHDMFVMNEPDGRTLMYVSYWDAGLRIVDVTDPAAPVELGGWNAFPEGHEGNLHTTVTDWIGDRRITVGSVEVGFAVVGGTHYVLGTDRSIVYVWDTTNPADIKLLGTWENPDQAPAGRDMVPGEEITSTHNIQVEDGKVYLAHYGLGIFVLDISTPKLQFAPAVLGFDREPGTNVWDIIVHEGVVYESGALGVRGHHFVQDVLGPLGVFGRA